MIEELHETYPGIVKMKSLVRSYIWWPKLCADIEVKVKDCAEYQASQPILAMGPLHPWEWPERP